MFTGFTGYDSMHDWKYEKHIHQIIGFEIDQQIF